MNETKEVVLPVNRMLLAAVVLGILGDALFTEVNFGINVSLWSLAALMGIWWVRGRLGSSWLSWLVLLPGAVGVAGLILFDSRVLQYGSVFCLFVTVGLFLWVDREDGPLEGGILWSMESIFLGVLGCFVSGFELFSRSVINGMRGVHAKIDWGSWRRAIRVGAGLFLALPLLCLFGTLFSMADPVFSKLMNQMLFQDPITWARHTFNVALMSWLSVGFLFSLLLRKAPEASCSRFGKCETSFALIEINTVLLALAGLFLLFVMVQLPYLFGGDEWVLSTSGLTYADYARRGFFELVTVVCLLLPMLLVADWLVGTESDKRWLHRAMIALCTMTLVIMMSAFKRLTLYVEVYGLTELRLYATSICVWLGIVLCWMMLTVCRERRGAFFKGALASFVSVFLLLMAVNPDRTIARVNVERHKAGNAADIDYLLSLSADAAPVLREFANQLEASDRLRINQRLNMMVAENEDDWRSWNLARARATELVGKEAE